MVSLGLLGIALPALLPDGVPPDPNDFRQNPDDRAKILRSNVQELYGVLEQRVATGNATGEERDTILREEARRYASWLDRSGAKQSESFDLGELYRTAKAWPEAERQFQIAVDFYKGRSEDLYVNSLLRLAHVRAEMGMNEGIADTIRRTYGAARGNKPPILLGVYLEIAPALARHKKYELAAQLIEEACGQHAQALVNLQSISGQIFMQARQYHLRQAAASARSLYIDAGQAEKADEVYERIMQLARQAAPAPG